MVKIGVKCMTGFRPVALYHCGRGEICYKYSYSVNNSGLFKFVWQIIFICFWFIVEEVEQ